MKTIVRTSDRLVLRSRPWLLAAIMSGGILLFAAVVGAKLIGGNQDEAGRAALPMGLLALAFAVFVQEDVVSLDRRAGEAVIRRRSVFGRRVTRLALDDIRAARLENDPGGERTKSGRPLQRAVLVLGDGKVVPLRTFYSGSTEAEATVATLKPWLHQGKRGRR